MTFREKGEGNITPLPDLTYQLPVSAPKGGSDEFPDRFPEVAEKWGFGIPQAGNTIDIEMSGKLTTFLISYHFLIGLTVNNHDLPLRLQFFHEI